MNDDAIVAQLHEVWRRHVAGDPKQLLAEWRAREPDVECRFKIPTPGSRRLLHAICSRFGVEPFRGPRMRADTGCVEVPKGFLDEILSPLVRAMIAVVEEAALRRTTIIVERWGANEKTS